MKFFEMLKNDVTGKESKNKEIATLEERIRYTEYMALAFGVAGCALYAAGWWVPALACIVVALRKAWIAADKRDIL